MKINKEKDITTYVEIDGEFEDDLGWGGEKPFLSKLRLKANTYGDNLESLEDAKEKLEEYDDFKPLVISIDAIREDKRKGETLRQDGEQENKVELSLDEAKALRDSLDDMIKYLEKK